MREAKEAAEIMIEAKARMEAAENEKNILKEKNEKIESKILENENKIENDKNKLEETNQLNYKLKNQLDTFKRTRINL